jgi:hypothetical protein
VEYCFGRIRRLQYLNAYGRKGFFSYFSMLRIISQEVSLGLRSAILKLSWQVRGLSFTARSQSCSRAILPHILFKIFKVCTVSFADLFDCFLCEWHLNYWWSALMSEVKTARTSLWWCVPRASKGISQALMKAVYRNRCPAVLHLTFYCNPHIILSRVLINWNFHCVTKPCYKNIWKIKNIVS